jgi:hypothetical protein
MNNGLSADQQHDEWDSFEECFDLPESFDDSEIDEEGELGEDLPVFDPMEDDFEPPQASDDLLDDPLIWIAIGEI